MSNTRPLAIPLVLDLFLSGLKMDFHGSENGEIGIPGTILDDIKKMLC